MLVPPMVTVAPLGQAELRTGEGDGEGVVIPIPFGLLFLSTTAAAVAAFVFAVFAGPRKLPIRSIRPNLGFSP